MNLPIIPFLPKTASVTPIEKIQYREITSKLETSLMSIPGILDCDVQPDKIFDISVQWWPPAIVGKYTTQAIPTGVLPILGASLSDYVEAKGNQLLNDSSGLGDLASATAVTFQWKIEGWNLVNAIWSALTTGRINIRSQCSVSGLLFSKSFDIDLVIPVYR